MFPKPMLHFFFIESVRKSIDKNNIVQTTLLDFSNAFDSISRDILIEKLKMIGFDSDAENLRKNFLSKRPQRVKFGSIYSNCIKLVRSVTHSLFLFIYVNDLSTAIDSNVTLIEYTDDCLVFASNKVEKITKIPWNHTYITYQITSENIK